MNDPLVTASSQAPGNGPTTHNVELSWQNVGSGLTGNCVYRSTGAGSTPQAPAIFVSTTPIQSWEDTGVANGTTYVYAVTEYTQQTGGPVEESGFSNLTTAVIPQSPSAPTGLTAVAQ